MLRTCATVSREDCKEEKSGETFCYCNNDLCNTPDRKLSDPRFIAPSHLRREGVARALQSGSSLNSATSDDEDLTKNRSSEGSGDGDSEDYYDATYFGEYEDDDEDSNDGRDTPAASPPGDVDVTEPPPFIVEEEIAKWKPKDGEKNVDKNQPIADNDIEFEDGDDETKQRKGGANVHDPSGRNNNNKNSNNNNKQIANGAMNVVPCRAVSSLFVSHIVFILVARL